MKIIGLPIEFVLVAVIFAIAGAIVYSYSRKNSGSGSESPKNDKLKLPPFNKTWLKPVLIMGAILLTMSTSVTGWVGNILANSPPGQQFGLDTAIVSNNLWWIVIGGIFLWLWTTSDKVKKHVGNETVGTVAILVALVALIYLTADVYNWKEVFSPTSAGQYCSEDAKAKQNNELYNMRIPSGSGRSIVVCKNSMVTMFSSRGKTLTLVLQSQFYEENRQLFESKGVLAYKEFVKLYAPRTFNGSTQNSWRIVSKGTSTRDGLYSGFDLYGLPYIKLFVHSS